MAQKETEMNEASRRNFLKNLAVMAPCAALAYRALANPSAATSTGTSKGTETKTTSGTEPTFVSESDPTAKALGYVADATKADRPKKGDTEGKDQTCSNCQLFVAGNPIGGKSAGKCLMIPAGPVHGDGWCKSWIKKA